MMPSVEIVEARNRAFQQLKPSCVKLSERALKYRLNRNNGKELTTSVEQLFTTLQSTADFLDPKLADYTFFPLSQVLQERQNVAVRTLEFVLQCLRLLLQKGWRKDINPELAVQLLILLTHLGGSVGIAKEKVRTSDELQVVAFRCECELLKIVRGSVVAKEAFLRTEYVPALGHSITVMLDAAKEGTSKDVQSAALDALQCFFECFDDREILASFFPGVISALTQVLTPTTSVKRHYRVIEKALMLLAYLIQRLLADTEMGLAAPLATLERNAVVNLRGKDVSWLTATASQVKLALANVVRVKSHDRAEVSNSLKTLCWTVLKQCRVSLSDSAPMILQVLVSLGDNSTKTSKEIAEMLVTDADMANILRDNLYDWLLSLSRIMLVNDEERKKTVISRIATAYTLLADTEVDMTLIDSILHTTLIDSMTNALHMSTRSKLIGQDQSLDVHSTSIIGIQQMEPSITFDMILSSNSRTQEILGVLQHLVNQLAHSNGAMSLARDALDNAMASENDKLLTNLWLSLAILKVRASDESEAGFEEFINIEANAATPEAYLCEDMYSFAIQLLSQDIQPDNGGWKQQALALEVLVFQSTRLRRDFKTELVDALYPIVHLMASPVMQLRNHAMTCLNITATSCGYSNAQDLLVKNVDYLVNAVGVKLNTFDLSPEAPQVLLMMIKLCGPVLLPYLDDLVDSIFEALECFHGYPSLVEMLFTVLRGVVEEGAKAPQFTITMDEKISHRKPSLQPSTIEALVAELRQRRERAGAPLRTEGLEREITENKRKAELLTAKKFPKSVQTPDADDDESEEDDSPHKPIPTEDSPPLTKTYTILQRITTLSQHHLPSSSASIRSSLISLLITSLPYLSQHEDTFLPLVHTLWPVLIPRLEDKEAYVVSGILDILGCICEGAGDFVSARIEGIWPILRKIWKSTAARQPVQGSDRGKMKGISTSRQLLGRRQSMLTKKDVITFQPPDIQLAISDASNALIKENSTTLTTTSTHQTPHQVPASTPPTYTPTTTLLILTSLRTFLLRLLHHVRISELIYTEILTQMLYNALVHEKRIDVKEALEARNPDAVWLVLERARWSGKGAEKRMEGREWWGKRRPRLRGLGEEMFREVRV